MTPTPPRTAAKIDALLAHSAWLDRLARQLVQDPHEADEVVQEAWVRAMESPPPDAEGNLRGWLARVVRRVVSRRYRSAIRRGDHELRASGPRLPRTPDDLAAEVALQKELSAAVLELPEAYRDVMLLRYFEDLPPRKIAARLGVPLNTVRSRLQRGGAQLRAKLDEEHGSRRAWTLSFLPLAARAALHEGAAALGLGVAGTVGVVVVLGGAVLIVRAPAGPAPARPEIVARAEGVPAGAATRPDGARPEPAAPRERVAIAAPENAAPEPAATGLRGAVHELDGVPAPHVRMRRVSEHAVRWQGGDRGWISGPGGSRRISAEDEERARDDAAFARRLLDGLPERDEWRATMLDAPLPGRDQRSGLDGAFAFTSDEPLAPAAIEVADPGWAQLARGTRVEPDGRREPAWIVARAHRIEGRLLGPGGTPVPRATVRVLFDVEAALDRLPFEFLLEAEWSGDDVSATDGAFLVRSAPVARGARLGFTAPGYRPYRLEVPSVLPDPFEVELTPLDETETWTISGTVRSRGGRPVAGALVALGDRTTSSDARGEFELGGVHLSDDDVPPTADLIAVASGRGAAIEADHGARLLEGSAPDRVQIVLDGGLGAVRGAVVGGAEARAGWRLALDDPTLLELSFSSVEKRAMGRSGDVEVAPDGTFEIAGLFERPYTLRFWRPGTGAVHLVSGVRSGDVLSVDPASSLRRIEGRVQDGAGARVSVVHRTFVTPDGQGGMTDSSAPTVCDVQGRFRIEGAPRAGAVLRVVLAGGDSFVVPVELIDDAALAAAGGLVLFPPATGILEVRSEFLAGEHLLRVEDAGGATVALRPLLPRSGGAGGGGGTAAVDEVASRDGRFPAVLVPASARTAVIVLPGGEHRALSFQPVPGGHVPVRLR